VRKEFHFRARTHFQDRNALVLQVDLLQPLQTKTPRNWSEKECETKMKANLPKCFRQLSNNEQDRINRALTDALDEELCDAQIIWIKMACGVLHRNGLSMEEVLKFLGGWRLMYRKNARIKDKAEQTDFINREMAAIFGDGGFPEDFVQSLREIGRS
jgi:hypothetical protein